VRLLGVLKRVVILAIVVSLAGVSALGVYYLWVNYNDNFHTVQNELVYRSAQMSADSLKKHINAEHIRTVVNLRGANTDKSWYQEESALLSAGGVTLIDIPLSSSTRVKPEDARRYIDLISNAPKPVLIHCLNGSDRTGLISAIYLIQNGVDEVTASRQLAVKFGHLPYGPWSDTKAMDESLDEFISTLQPGTD
jgi:protein tyrosine phosphatase (PTP) superfamily phosphohydrolase (DUF442 family)